VALVQLVLLVLKDHRETLEPQDHRASKETLEPQDHRAFRETMELLEQLVPKVSKATQVQRVRSEIM
jgi:hypothetical protein